MTPEQRGLMARAAQHTLASVKSANPNLPPAVYYSLSISLSLYLSTSPSLYLFISPSLSINLSITHSPQLLLSDPVRPLSAPLQNAPCLDPRALLKYEHKGAAELVRKASCILITHVCMYVCMYVCKRMCVWRVRSEI